MILTDEPTRREIAIQKYISEHSELADYEVYLAGEFIAKLLPFLQRVLMELHNADTYKRAYEEHLMMCVRPVVMYRAPEQPK